MNTETSMGLFILPFFEDAFHLMKIKFASKVVTTMNCRRTKPFWSVTQSERDSPFTCISHGVSKETHFQCLFLFFVKHVSLNTQFFYKYNHLIARAFIRWFYPSMRPGNSHSSFKFWDVQDPSCVSSPFFCNLVNVTNCVGRGLTSHRRLSRRHP